MTQACSECGREPDPDQDVVVHDYRFPEGTRAVCNVCYQRALAEHSTLTERQAEIVALRQAGYTQRETADALGVTKGSINKTEHDRIRKKILDARRGIWLLRALGEIEPIEDEA